MIWIIYLDFVVDLVKHVPTRPFYLSINPNVPLQEVNQIYYVNYKHPFKVSFFFFYTYR